MFNPDENPNPRRLRPVPQSLVRPALLLLGWLMVALAAVGVVVPGLPTVPFLLVAAWAFARSSQRFHDWLYNHPRFGPPLRDWPGLGATTRRANILEVAMMTVSFCFVVYVSKGWIIPAIVAGCLIPAGIFVSTRPEGPRT